MRTIYIDSEFKCHATNDGTMRAVATDFFDGKCDTFVEGHRFIPAGESRTDSRGNVFHGPTIAPWRDVRLLYAAQAEYERSKAQLADAEQALKIIFEGEEE